jgi:hypothetical protein
MLALTVMSVRSAVGGAEWRQVTIDRAVWTKPPVFPADAGDGHVG